MRGMYGMQGTQRGFVKLLIYNGSGQFHYWAGKYPGKLGWLVSPHVYRTMRCRKAPFWPWIEYAIDNEAFPAWQNGRPWDEGAFFELLQETKKETNAPMWVVVPDVVANPEETKRNWQIYADRVAAFGWPLAFAVQNGMGPKDVPSDADVIFVGGSDADNWKWKSAPMWCEHFPRVHIGRVNSARLVRYSEKIGAESVDGTSWFRDPSRPRLVQLEAWLAGEPEKQIELML